MMTAPSPEAHFDVLFVLERLGKISGAVTRNEISLFCYLACLLSVFRGEPSSVWGYQFAATKVSAPYSGDLAEAIELLSGTLIEDQGGLGLALLPQGQRELTVLGRLSRFRTRSAYLEVACASALAMPMPRVSEAVSQEPQLRLALDLSSSRPLTDDVGREAIHRHFSALAEAFPEDVDLFLPAVVWLTYMAQELDRRLENSDISTESSDNYAGSAP